MKRFPKTLRTSDEKETILDESRILVAFIQATKPEEVQHLVKELGLKLESNESRNERRSTVEINNTDNRYWLKSVDNSPISDVAFERIEQALSGKVEWIGPVYRAVDKTQHIDFIGPVPNVLLLRKHLSRKYEEQIGELQIKMNEPKSRYLSEHNYFELPDTKKVNAFELQQRFKPASGDVVFENMPMIRDWCAVPNDTLFAQQWNMTQIQGPQAWDISTGSNAVIVAVIDSGTDLTHPDLQLAGTGIDLGDMMSDGSPNNFGTSTGHGTCCSGISAGTFNNAAGVSGVAGSCRILPLAISTFSDVEIANGVNWSVANGADSISMSFSIPQSALVDTELTNAFAANVVLCAATANANINGVAYPARHPVVMAIGASDQIDNRKSPASPDGENWWGSNFGAEISVVAPGVLIPSTDIQGNAGFNPAAGAVGDYFMTFNGTSSATPHVAGLAALIRSQYAALTSGQIRNIIERSAQKTGTVAYNETTGRPNGTWNQEMGYGRINAFRALDFADIMIKDWAGDNGIEPSASSNFWDFSDIVVRITDDNVFNPSNPSQSKNVEKGQPNFIYVRVTNNGPREARNVAVSCRITPYVGLQFQYPSDWNNNDATHVTPTAVTNTFAAVAAGSSVLAKFTISAAQTDILYGWQNDHPWHPCLLSNVIADNDFAFASGAFNVDPLSQRKNNLAQRNLTVIDVLGDLASASFAFPFIAGHLINRERMMQLTIDRRAMPDKAQILLSLDDDGSHFPLVNFDNRDSGEDKKPSPKDIVYLERTRIETTLGCCRGTLTLEKGSYFTCSPNRKIEPLQVKGGEVILKNGKRYVRLQESITTVQLEKAPGQMYPLSLVTEFNGDAEKGKEYTINVSQQNLQGVTVGGATTVYIIK